MPYLAAIALRSETSGREGEPLSTAEFATSATKTSKLRPGELMMYCRPTSGIGALGAKGAHSCRCAQWRRLEDLT